MGSVRTAIGVKAIAFAGALFGGLVPPALAEGLKDTTPPLASSSAPATRGVWFSGGDWVKDARYFFDGAVIALNGDLSRDGFALRGYGSWAEFDRHPGDGRTWQGDVMLGYLFSRSHLYGDVFIGVDYQDVRLRPDDPAEAVRGTEVGFKVATSLATDRELPHYFSLSGSYSTAFDTYWARARLGLTHNKVVGGIEGIVVGDEGFDAQRLGAFVIFDLNLLPNRPIEVTLSAGHQFVSDSSAGGIGGSDGTYGSISFSFPF